jgi:hypothetical protein
VRAVQVLNLRRNLNHQRPIAVALCHVQDTMELDAVVVMDADGEDRPEDVPRLVQEFHRQRAQRIIFAERTRRSEGVVFGVFYALYRLIHRVLTGRAVRVGNLSIVPRSALVSLGAAPELWNHYAAAVFKLRLQTGTIQSSRGHRLAGTSRMNFVSLVIHGLSAISVFGEIVGTRLLAATGALILLCLSGMGVVDSHADQLHGQQFDSIIYIDVLEHIDADRDELERAANALQPGGFLVVLAPSHQWLYTALDKALGHYRR